MKPHKISTLSAYSDDCYFNFFYPLSDWVEILWGFTKFFFKQVLKVSVFYLEKQKSFIPKKKLSHFQYQNRKALFQFQWRFWVILWYFTLLINFSTLWTLKKIQNEITNLKSKIKKSIEKPYLHCQVKQHLSLNTLN